MYAPGWIARLGSILLIALIVVGDAATFAAPAVFAQSAALNVPLQVHNPLTQERVREPVTAGVPLPRALGLTDAGRLRLVDSAGNAVPAQFTPLARWGGAPGDSAAPIRWVLVDFQASVPPEGTAVFYLQDGGPGPAPEPPLVITDDPDALVIDTGAARFSISKADGSLSADGLSAPLTGRAQVGGVTYRAAGPVTVQIAQPGALRLSVRVQGAFRAADGAALLDYTARYWFYAGLPAVRLFYTVENNTPCPLRAEDGQIECHYIGSAGSVDVDDLSLALAANLGADPAYTVGGESGGSRGALAGRLLLYQDSSGGAHWDRYLTMQDWDGNALDARPRMQAYVTFAGYRTTLDGAPVESGSRAPGWLTVTGSDGAWSVGVRDFWQNFPKALRAAPDGALEIGLLPGEFGPQDYRFNLRAGEHKTHEIWLSPSADLPAFDTPLFAQAPAVWYVDSGAFGYLALPDAAAWPDYEDFVRYQLDTAPTYDSGYMDWYPNLYAAIEGADFYGLFDYGDWPIDYEGYGVAPLNIKYDYDYGMWMQWARGGDPRWFALAEAADRHTADIDILHTLHTPRHWSDGIAFGHSYHDEDGFTNPHRNEGGTHPDVAFGLRGMLLTYYLTGYEKAYESALELADCIAYRLHNDWQLCDRFPTGTCSGEGYALNDQFPGGPSRPAANSLSMVVEAYRATGDPRYRVVADALVSSVRPADQSYINGPTGEDAAIKPWVLNLYLRALAAYIEMRGEFGLPDDAGAVDSYLGFADWLRTYPLIPLDPIDTGPRAAYPYEWWFDGRQGDPADEWAEGNNIPSINNWLLLGADAMAYAYRLSGNADYLALAEQLFRTGSRDPFYPDDANTYSTTKETINGITFGHTFLYVWAQRPAR